MLYNQVTILYFGSNLFGLFSVSVAVFTNNKILLLSISADAKATRTATPSTKPLPDKPTADIKQVPTQNGCVFLKLILYKQSRLPDWLW